MIKTFVHTGFRLALLACALPALAQDGAAPTQRIEMSATRYDVRTLCASIDEELPARLARALHALDNRALVAVQFQIEGRRITDVATNGGSFDTQVATRRAVRSMHCDSASASRQKVRFEVHFNLDDLHAPSDVAAATGLTIAQSGQRPASN
jgi:hypothetical protein